MTYVLAALVVLPVLLLIIAALTSRANVRSGCSISDPANDLRMREAFEEAAGPRGRESRPVGVTGEGGRGLGQGGARPVLRPADVPVTEAVVGLHGPISADVLDDIATDGHARHWLTHHSLPSGAIRG